MIHAFRPKYIAMVGIAAGVRDRVKYGDVIIANPCWDWGSGKHTHRSSDGVARFAAAPFQAHHDGGLREQCQALAADQPVLDEIRRGWNGDTPEHALSARVGPLASGAAVLADEDVMARIAEQHREIIGVEMEGYGVFVAAEESAEPRAKALVIKSVVDYGGTEKDDRFQGYGAYTAAAFLAALARKHL
jgi:nucleoside phosphorylase